MTVLIIGIVAAVVTGLLGAGIGWLFCGAHLEMELTALKSQNGHDTSSSQEAESGRMSELFARLAELTSGVASEVGRHTGNIEAINAELASVQEGDAIAVVAAVQRILKTNEKMQQELAVAESRLQEQQKELVTQTEAARTDQLTKITNRRALDEELKKCVQEFQRSALPFCIMMLDVDHFKKFNDTHGHLAGDAVLKYVAQNIKSSARASELVARYGGEEFVVVFRGDSVTTCRERADKLRASINEMSITFEGKQLRVTASAGLAEIGIGEDEKGLVRRADAALYAAKKAGRNCTHWNDGQRNLPISPALLAVLNAEGPVPGLSPIKSPASHAKPRRFELSCTRFSDASFSPNLDRRVSEWKRTGHAFSMAICAIDGIDQLAKTHGDELLRRVVNVTAGVVSSCLRDMDQFSIFGAGSFAISLPTAQIHDAAQVGDRVRKAVERLHGSTGSLPQFTVSVGVAQVIEGNDSSRLFYRAQLALEAAQEATGNSIFIHDGLNPVPANLAAQQAALTPA